MVDHCAHVIAWRLYRQAELMRERAPIAPRAKFRRDRVKQVELDNGQIVKIGGSVRHKKSNKVTKVIAHDCAKQNAIQSHKVTGSMGKVLGARCFKGGKRTHTGMLTPVKGAPVIYTEAQTLITAKE